MRTIFLFTLLTIFGINSFGQKITGIGGELSMLAFKPNARMWISRTKGFEVFGGVSSELTGGFKPNDYEGGLKLLNTFIYNRTNRSYFGLMGKWKWMNLNVDESNVKVNLPVFGILIGKEWLSKRLPRKGFAIELGYQYGVKKYEVPIAGQNNPTQLYDEFPLILNLRYTFYKKK